MQTRRAITAVGEWSRALGTKTGFRAAKNKENKGQFKLKLIFIRYFWVSLSVLGGTAATFFFVFLFKEYKPGRDASAGRLLCECDPPDVRKERNHSHK